MKKTFYILTILFSLIFVSLGISYIYVGDRVLSSLITFGVITYHFIMRLFVGYFVSKIKVNTNCWWLNEHKGEQKFYSLIGIKKFKKKLPTWDSSAFDIISHSLLEVLQATCNAEIVHEVIFVLSYLPLLLIIPFGSTPVFVITSLLASLIDLCFVFVQRYNRPRLIRLIKLKNNPNEINQ